jgi:hypothetical protein
MRKEYWLIAAALAITGAVLLYGRAVAPKVVQPEGRRSEVLTETESRPGYYRNARYGFEMSYPTDAHIGPVGADGKPDPQGTVFAMSKDGNIVELYAYEPSEKEKNLSALDFAKQSALASKNISMAQGAAVASFTQGVVKFGSRALVAESDSAAFFIKRPGYFLIGMLYGPVAGDPGQVNDVLRSLNFSE